MFTSVTKEDMRKVIKATFIPTGHAYATHMEVIEAYEDNKLYTLPELLTQGRQDGYLTVIGHVKYSNYIQPLFELAAICKDIDDTEKITQIYDHVVAPANGMISLKDLFDGKLQGPKGYTRYRLEKIERIKRGEK